MIQSFPTTCGLNPRFVWFAPKAAFVASFLWAINYHLHRFARLLFFNINFKSLICFCWSLIASINKPTKFWYSILFKPVCSSVLTTSGIINSTSCAINPIFVFSGSILISLYSTPRNNKVLSNAFSIVLIFVLIFHLMHLHNRIEL